MFDTHCHLNLPEFFPNPEEEIVKAKEAGVNHLLIPGTNLKNSQIAINLANTYENVFAAVGVHPTEKLDSLNLDKVIISLEEMVGEDKKIVAVGEIGLDYYHLNTSVSVQKEFFEAQIKLALKYNLAIILHNRHATEDMLPLLSEIGWDNFTGKTVFHCCEPNQEILKMVIKHNLYIGIDGDLTFDETKQEFLKNIPLANLVLETDSPFLTPKPVREEGRNNNSPVNLVHIAKSVAILKNKEVQEITLITTQNAQNLFSLDTS